MSVQWNELKTRHQQILDDLLSPSLDNKQREALQKELSQLGALIKKHEYVIEVEGKLSEVKRQVSREQDQELAQMFQEDYEELDQQYVNAQRELNDMLFPPSEHDNRSVFLEIRAGTGGQEAALFAADLVKMYTNYGQQKNWRVNVESCSGTDLGGVREVDLHIKGKQAYGHLKYESGVHRVQRVPSTETSGRIHTSTATVAVLPEAKEVDVTISPADLRIDVFRASGAGGQHVNTTDSAVRITHIPTGVVVSCQDERSQHKNKAKAMKSLQSRILAAQLEKQHAALSKQRKELVGTGMRSEKVRTYNYPQNRVTDHQVNLTLKKLDIVMEGNIEEIIQALRDADRQQRMQQGHRLT